MVRGSSILIYGHDATLLDTRRWVLETAGFEVVTVSTMKGAEDAMANGAIGLFVLCHTLTPEERLAAIAAAALRPDMQKLSICTIDQHLGNEEETGHTLDNFAGADGLIAAAWKLLN